MDRNRENRRGGGTVSGHGSSSRRRPRSTYKDSSVGEEEEVLNESHDSARLRERSNSNNNKKERSSLTLSSSRNKRKRPGLQDRFHGNRDDDGGRGDESSEDSGGDDDDDDDDEPPRPPNPSRRTAKFKSQWKVSEDMIGVGLVSVPRKARSASVKRGHDSSTVSLGAQSASDGHAHRQSSPSPARPSGISVSPSSSNVSAKPGRRMKPIGTKPRASKMAKVSNSISEREVEVAEVLFGLTRQFHTQHSASESFTTKPDVKESSNDASVPVLAKVSSPIPASSVVSSPVSAPISPPSSSPALTLPQLSTPTPAVAPKRKRPRPAKPEEATPAITMRPPASLGSICATTTTTTANVSGTKNEVEQASQATKMEVSSSRVESNVIFTGGLIKGIPSVASTTTASSSSICVNPIPVPTPSAISIQREIPIMGEKIAGPKTVDSKPITSEKMGAKIADSKPALPVEKKPSAVSEELDKVASEVSETPVDQIVTKEIDAPANDLSSACPDVKAEDGKMSPLPKTENTSEEKFKIDLMAPPAKSSHDMENDSGPDAAGNADSELAKKEIVEITNVSEVKEVAVKIEREQEKLEEEVKEEEAEKKYDKTDNGEEKGIQKQHINERTVELQLEEDNLEKDSSKQQLQKQGRISRGELRAQKPERPAVAPGNAGSSPSAVASLPIPITVAGWSGGLPPLGYFGPVAANWPGAPSLQVVSMEGNTTTPTFQPAYMMQQSRQSWKRCAIHSYIAHFINCQQKMASPPFWAAANYSCSAALYGSKAYNLNMSLPPPSESINLGGSLPGKVSSSSVGNSGSSSRNLGSLQDRIVGSTALAAFGNQNPKEKAATSYMDSRRKQSSHQQTTQQTTSQNMQHGPATFGFPITQSGSGGANLSTAGNTGYAAASLNSRNSALGAASSAGTGAANSSLASITGAEAQYLTILQQSGLPLAIPQAHFGATYNAGQQQGAQFFNGSFYAPQLLHPPPPQPQMQPHQQGPQNPSTSSGSSSSQKHQQQLQGSRNFPSSQKQQQQQVTPTPSPSNSQQQHHLPASQTRQIEREASNGADSPSTADSRLPMIQKGLFSQASSSNSNFNVNPPSLLATGMPVLPQDLAFMAALGGKHNGKQQQQQQPPSEIGHLQQQGGAGFAIQQHHGNGPTIQMSFKGVEFSSQPLAAMSRISGSLGFPSIAQGHTALQGIPEPTRHPHQIAAQAQQIVLQSGQQSQRSGQMQRTQLTSTDEVRNSTDSISNASGRGREDDRKMPVKGGLPQSLNFSRIDAENSTNMHGSPTDGGLSTSSLLTNSVDSMGRTLNLIASPGNGNHNTRSPQPSTQQLNQNAKQSMGRAKNVTNPNVLPPVVSAQANLTSYGDRMPVSSNLNKFQTSTSSFPGQNQKQVQQPPQWKMGQRTTIPSNMSSTVGAPSQAVLAAPLTNYAQQGRNQQGSSNLGATTGAPPPAAFASRDQPPLQQNNSSSLPGSRLSSTSPVPASVVGSLPISTPPPVSKSVGTPASRAATGSKGPIQQQKSTAPASNKKSSPVGGRGMPSILSSPHMSQSSSGKSSQQQYQLQQSVPPIGSGQPVNLKNQQYHNQAHINPQQILFSNNQYLQQQAVQQSQLSQSAHQTSGFHQKQQMHGSSSPQVSFSNPHLRRQQDPQQQMQPVSSPSSNAGALSLGSPALTLGGASCAPAKIMPSGSLAANSKGSTVLHVPYNPLNSTGTSQQQSGSPHAALSSQYMQAVTNVSAKSAEQKSASDGLNQDQVNGVRLLQNSINLSTSSVQSRNHFNASSPQGSSIRMPAGSLRKAEGGNTSESMTSPGGLSLSMAPSSGIRTNGGLISSGNAVQHAKTSSVSSNAVHSGQISPMPMHPPSVSIAAGTISPATAAPPGLHGQAAASVVQP